MSKRSFFIILLVSLLLPIPGLGADVPLKWDASPGASGYKVYLSTDQGLTWEPPVDVGNVTAYVWPGVPDTGLILFRASAYNDQGEAIKFEAGAWYNGEWKPPLPTTGLGIQ